MPMVGDGARLLVARAFDAAPDSALVDAALATFRASYLARPAAHTVLLPGVRDVLDVARALELPCAVVTNKPRDVTTLVLDALGIGHFSERFGVAATVRSSLRRRVSTTSLHASA